MIKRSQFLIFVIIISSIFTFAYDLIVYYSSLNIQSWSYIHEALSLSNVVLFFLYLRKQPLGSERDVQKNLKSFILLLAVLYVVIIFLKFLFKSEFTIGTFPKEPANEYALIYSNLVSLAAIFLITPTLIILGNLIKYKYKKSTNFFFVTAAAAAFSAIVFSIAFNFPLNFSFGRNDVSEEILFLGNGLFVISIAACFFLSLRNSWITYLSRKEKISYFFVSVVVVIFIIYLNDFAFYPAVEVHSLALGLFTNLSYFFLVIYSVMASLSLLTHLPTARVFERKMKEVSSLHNLSRVISAELDFDKLIRLVTEMCTEVLDSRFTWLEIYDEKSQELQVISSSQDETGNTVLIEHSPLKDISKKIIKLRKALVINSLQKEERLQLKSIHQQNIASLAGIPLISSNGRLLGILYSTKAAAFGFDPDDINMLEAYANQASTALENVDLMKSSLERERMERELQIAREVQMRLLPQDTPQIPEIEIETLTITAYEVGGDYYDFYSLNEGSMGMVIGDVSGKGTSAAFYMAEAKGIIQSLARMYNSPGDILVETNKLLYASIEKKSFISMLTCYLNVNENYFKFARAGHCPVIHYSAESGKTNILQPEGIAVGLDSGKIFDAKLEELEISIAPDDILALYTDGLSEARNAMDEEFGESRLCTIIEENAEMSAASMKDLLIDEILKFLDGENLHDDLTLLLIKIK